MLDNISGWEIGALLLIAFLIFGDRLPTVIGDGLRMLRNLRDMARNATSDLSRELGTDIQLEDLHPKTLIRKHLLSKEDEAALRKPLQGIYNDLRSDLTGVRDELKDAASAADPRSSLRSAVRDAGTSSRPAEPGATPSRPVEPGGTPSPSTFDVEAT